MRISNEPIWLISANVAAWIAIMIFLGLSILIERKRLGSIKILHISIIAMMCGLSAILTNLLGYNITMFTISIKLALGQWIIFIIGLFYGPTLGVVGAICADIVGSTMGLGGSAFHAGFMFSSVLIGFTGGFVLFTGKKFILLKAVIFYSIAYTIQSLLLNPIWLFSMGYGEYIFVDIIIKLIKLPISLTIYISLITGTYFLFIQILKRMYDEDSWWYKRTSEKQNAN